MSIDINNLDKHIEILKNMKSREYIENYLSKLSDDEIMQIQAVMYMGRDGIDYISEIITKKINNLGMATREIEISQIAGKANLLKDYLNAAEIILHGYNPSVTNSPQPCCKEVCLVL